MRARAKGLFATGASMFLAIGLNACGVDDQGSQVSDDGPKSQPTIVVMGGNNSCKTDAQDRENSPYGQRMYPKLVELVDHMNQNLGVTPKTLLSCYPWTDPEITYVTSEDPEVLVEVDRETFTSTLFDYADPDAPLFLVGHSYGGWLSMKTAIEVANERMFTALVSIDPISRIECTFSRPGGCTRAPRDMPVADLELIAAQSDNWNQYYQTRTFYLHSSTIAQADENTRVNVGHSPLASHAQPWMTMRNLVDRIY